MSSNTTPIPEKDRSVLALRASAWAGSTTAAAHAMRCSMSGWIFALAIAGGHNEAVGRRTITIPVSSQDRRCRQAFVGYPLLSRVSAASAMPGLLRRERQSARGVLARKVGRGSQRLEAKKSTSKSDQLDDFREAAKVLDQMERKREKKTRDRARRREANKTVPSSPRSRRDGELDGTPSSVSKAGQNPFKKEKIVVSKFDVNDIRKVEFVGSFEDNESQWPKTTLPEIAFLGRSNVGKSSMLNTLFGESVAKVSKTPGRTRHINIFKGSSKLLQLFEGCPPAMVIVSINCSGNAKNSKGKDVCCFADLPGYGYAKIGKEQQRTIETFLEMYLERRSNLKLLILLTDARREPLSSDAGILEYAQDNDNRRYKVLVVATKVDKLNAMEAPLNIGRLREAYDLPPGLPVSFSAITGEGKKEIWAYIRQAAAAAS